MTPGYLPIMTLSHALTRPRRGPLFRAARVRAGALVGFAVLATGGCKGFREMFPRREEVFIPVPLPIGERRLVGADSAWVLAGDGWEIRAPHQDPLVEAEKILEGTSRRWQRLFRGVPPLVVIEFHEWKGGRDRAAIDSVRAMSDSARLVRVFYVPEQEMRGPSRSMVSPVVALPVVLRWLGARLDSVAPTVARAPGSIEPYPDWIETALPHWLAATSTAAIGTSRVARLDADRLIPLSELLTMPRPPFPREEFREPGEPPPRMASGRRLQKPDIFVAESQALIDMIVEKEGEAFLGWMSDELARGSTIDAALATAATLPRNVAGLDQAFRDWLGARRR